MLRKIRLIIYPLLLTSALLTACGDSGDQQSANEQPPLEDVSQSGEVLFKQNCMQCHRINRRVLGPALNGVHQRWQNETDEMVAYIRNAPAYRQSDREFASYARALNKASPSAHMPEQPLTEKQVRSILDYLESASD